MDATTQPETLTKVHAKNILFLLNAVPELYFTTFYSSINPSSTLGRQTPIYNADGIGVGFERNASNDVGDDAASDLETGPLLTTENSPWGLRGQSCFNFESNLAFHLYDVYNKILSAAAGRTPDRVKLAISLSECDRINKKREFPSQARKLVVKLQFYDKGDKVLHASCIQIDPESSWDELKSTVEDFMPAETLWKVCQFKAKGAPKPPISKNAKCDNQPNEQQFEFVKLTAELEMCFVEDPQKLLKLSKCSIDDSRYLPSAMQFFNVSTSDSKSEGRAILKPTLRFSSSKRLKTKGSSFTVAVSPVPNAGTSQPIDLQSLPANASSALILATKEHENKERSKSLILPSFPAEKKINVLEMVTFKVGPEEQLFMAYKYNIMSMSPVFDKMLTVDMKEKNENVIPLPDEDPQVVRNFLSLLYGNTSEDFNNQVLEIPALEILNLLEFAHMYELTQLFGDLNTALVTMPRNKLTLEAVLKMFVAGCQFEMTDLKFRALQLIKENKNQILYGDGQMEFKHFMAGKDPEYLYNLIFELL